MIKLSWTVELFKIFSVIFLADASDSLQSLQNDGYQPQIVTLYCLVINFRLVTITLKTYSSMTPKCRIKTEDMNIPENILNGVYNCPLPQKKK